MFLFMLYTTNAVCFAYRECRNNTMKEVNNFISQTIFFIPLADEDMQSGFSI